MMTMMMMVVVVVVMMVRCSILDVILRCNSYNCHREVATVEK